MLRLNFLGELICRINDRIDIPADTLLRPAQRPGYFCQVYVSQDEKVNVAGRMLFRPRDRTIDEGPLDAFGKRIQRASNYVG